MKNCISGHVFFTRISTHWPHEAVKFAAQEGVSRDVHESLEVELPYHTVFWPGVPFAADTRGNDPDKSR